MKYAYDALNLLTEKVSKGSGNRATMEEIVSGKGSANTVSNKESITTRYTYDILQTYTNVLTKTVNGETTAYEYGLERIAAYTGTDAEQIKTQYIYDVRGSVIETVTAKAQRDLSEATAAPTVTVQGYAYTPYGEQIGTKINGSTYNGEYYDAAAGMLNLRARQYEPAQMRFSQPDIVRGYAVNPQSVNRYAYCVNNPMMYADPSGASLITAVSNAFQQVRQTVTKVANNLAQTTVGKAINEKIVQPIKNAVKPVVNSIGSKVEKIKTDALTWATYTLSNVFYGRLNAKQQTILDETNKTIKFLQNEGKLTLDLYNNLLRSACTMMADTIGNESEHETKENEELYNPFDNYEDCFAFRAETNNTQEIICSGYLFWTVS